MPAPSSSVLAMTDPSAAGAGWTCSTCGAHVQSGVPHFCVADSSVTGAIPSVEQTIQRLVNERNALQQALAKMQAERDGAIAALRECRHLLHAIARDHGSIGDKRGVARVVTRADAVLEHSGPPERSET